MPFRYRRRLRHALRRLEAKRESLTFGAALLYSAGHSAAAEKLFPKVKRITHSIDLIESRMEGR